MFSYWVQFDGFWELQHIVVIARVMVCVGGVTVEGRVDWCVCVCVCVCAMSDVPWHASDLKQADRLANKTMPCL